MEDDTYNESTGQAEPQLTLTNPLHQQVHEYQDLCAEANAIVRLPQSIPQALTIQKQKQMGKGKCNMTETMPIVVVVNATQLWEQMPSLQNQTTICNMGIGKTLETNTRCHRTELRTRKKEHGISILFIDVGVLI